MQSDCKYFTPNTDEFVVLRTFSCGTTKYGYGATRDRALADSLFIIPFSVRQTEVAVYRRTNQQIVRRLMLLDVYERVD